MQAGSQANAVTEQANLDMEARSKRALMAAAEQQTDFLNSGLTLEGTPMSAILNTFDVGIKDVNRIGKNANTQSSNIINSARMEALGSMASMASGFGGGGGGSGAQVGQSQVIGSASNSNGLFGSQGSMSRGIEFGNVNAEGPIQGFGGFGA